MKSTILHLFVGDHKLIVVRSRTPRHLRFECHLLQSISLTSSVVKKNVKYTVNVAVSCIKKVAFSIHLSEVGVPLNASPKTPFPLHYHKNYNIIYIKVV